MLQPLAAFGPFPSLAGRTGHALDIIATTWPTAPAVVARGTVFAIAA
jgi:hypothetical protein